MRTRGESNGGGAKNTESTHFWAKHELNFVHVVHFSDACWAPCQVILQVCCAIVARMLLFVGFWLAGPKYVHVSYVGPTYLGIILQGPGPGLGACLFLCPPGVSAGGALAAQVWQGKGCFFIILGPKPVRWRACLFLCPAGISAGGWKGDISSTGLFCRGFPWEREISSMEWSQFAMKWPIWNEMEPVWGNWGCKPST